MALQETHSSKKDINKLDFRWNKKWCTLWGYTEDKKAGVALFFKRDFFKKIYLVESNKHVVGAKTIDKQEKESQWWSYNPNIKLVSKRIFSMVLEGKNIAVAGDFNVHMDEEHKQYNKGKAKMLQAFIFNNGLVDMSNEEKHTFCKRNYWIDGWLMVLGIMKISNLYLLIM